MIKFETISGLDVIQFEVICENFELQFEEVGDIVRDSTKDKSVIYKIIHEINNESIETENSYVDARNRLFIYHKSGNIDTICLSRDASKININGRYFTTPGCAYELLDLDKYHSYR